MQLKRLKRAATMATLHRPLLFYQNLTIVIVRRISWKDFSVLSFFCLECARGLVILLQKRQ